MKSVILVANGVQDEEFFYPYYRLQEEGEVVVSITVKKKNFSPHLAVGKYGIPIPVGITSDDLYQHKDADLVIIPGGWECPELLRMDDNVLSFVEDMNADKKIIGAICHGPQVLISAGVVNKLGERFSGYIGIKDDVVNAGGRYSENMVISNNIITAPHYRDNPRFIKACIDAVRERSSS